MLGEGLLVEDLHAVAEHDGVADFHHRRLDVQREHHAGLVCVLDLLLVELAQRLLAHEHAVDDVAVFQRRLGLEHDRLAALGLQLHPHLAVAVQGHRLLAVVEVATLHGRHVGTRSLRPLAHAVRVLTRVLLDRVGGATVRIAFAQNRVHGAAENLAVAFLERLLLIVLRLRRIVGKRVALLLQLLDRGGQLRHGRADVRQLDDVGIGRLRQLAELAQVVRHALLFGQVIAELGEDARRHGNVAGFDVDPGRLGEGSDDR